ncbi:coiled-coil domain-containing protein [Patescibacteria group bacterium]
MPKRFFLIILLVFCSSLFSGFNFIADKLSWPPKVWAVDEEECRSKEESQDWDGAEKCWEEYFGTKKRTLKNEIDNKIVQIDLTSRKIVSTQQRTDQLIQEVEGLGGKIENLDSSLDQLSEVLIKRVTATYKRGTIDPFVLFLSSNDFSEFVARYQYLRRIQAHDRQLLLQMEMARSNYEDQKILKEEKQIELEQWQKKLEQEKAYLNRVAKAKQVLLKETEVSYQRTLSRISAEKSKLAGVSVFGKPVEFKQWSGENNYFNQTDSRWAMMLIGGGVYYQPSDPSYMWKYGCAVTSMAMVLKKWGVDIDPGRLSQSPVYRADLIAWQDIPGGFGGSIKVVGHGYGGWVSWGEIDSTLNSGNWVIVYISGVGHYVVLLNKEGDDYKMHDPYFGPNMSFNSKYSKGSVDETIVYSR